MGFMDGGVRACKLGGHLLDLAWLLALRLDGKIVHDDTALEMEAALGQRPVSYGHERIGQSSGDEIRGKLCRWAFLYFFFLCGGSSKASERASDGVIVKVGLLQSAGYIKG